MNYKLDVELSEELEPYRSAIEATIKPYIKIELTDNNNPNWWQSKFGGLPYMPKNFNLSTFRCFYVISKEENQLIWKF